MLTRRRMLSIVAGTAAGAGAPGGRSPSESRVIDVSFFGIQPSPADNFVAQNVMRLHAIAHPGSVYRFTSGQLYDLSGARFLYGVRDIEILAHGARFRNTRAGTFGYSDANAAFYIGSGSLFHPMCDGDIDPQQATSGELILDAKAGDYGVVLLDPVKASAFRPGTWAMINWMSRQRESFPPNPAYFEYIRIVSADQITGRIIFERPLNCDYKSRAPDHHSNPNLYNTLSGRARILSLNRDDYQICERFVLRGGQGVGFGFGKKSPDPYDGIVAVAGAIHVELHDVEFDGFFPSMTRDVSAFRSNFVRGSELDKMIQSVRLQDCNVTDLTQGSGVRDFQMIGGSLKSSGRANWDTQIRANSVRLVGVHVASHSHSQNGAQVSLDTYAKKLVEIDGCTLYPNAVQGAGFGTGGAVEFFPDQVSDNRLAVSPENPRRDAILFGIDIGATIAVASGPDPAIFSVTEIGFDALGFLILGGSHEGDNVPDRYVPRVLRNIRRFVDHSNNTVIDAPDRYRLLRTTRNIAEPRQDAGEGARLLSFRMSAGELYVPPVQGYLRHIAITVDTPYTGSDSNACLEVGRVGVGARFNFGIIDVSAAGVRRSSTVGATGARSKDVWNGRLPGQIWVELLALHLHGDHHAAFKDSYRSRLADLTVEIALA